MVLAEQRFIPRVWAAVIRVMSVPRSLVAFERGAVGPNKDCAYEGPYIKAITGCPIALEGAEAACAHLSPIGNIAKAVPDLWSNESVNNVKLLGAMAPTVCLEQLVYATRLMNTASSHGRAGGPHPARLVGGIGRGQRPAGLRAAPGRGAADLPAQIIAEPTPYLRTRKAAQAHAGAACARPSERAADLLKARDALAGPPVPPGRAAARGRGRIHRPDDPAARPGESPAGGVRPGRAENFLLALKNPLPRRRRGGGMSRSVVSSAFGSHLGSSLFKRADVRSGPTGYIRIIV